MADVAVTRLQLVDNSRRRDDGKRIHRILPWQIVTLSDGTGQLAEPTDFVPDVVTAQPTRVKEITGILFVDDSLYVKTGTAGAVGMAQIFSR